MENRELAHVVAAVLMMFVVSSLGFVIAGNSVKLLEVFVFSVIIVGVPVIVKKGVAYWFDASIEHELWKFYRFGYKPKQHFRRPLPFGIILPVIVSAITLGTVKVMTFLTYEARALKHRAAKRFGPYSYTSVTDWHHGLIGAAGVLILLLISLVSYFPGWETLSKMAAYYAFWNLIPVSKLDGAQIFFGNRVLWVVLFLISIVFAMYALLLPV